MSLLDSGFVGLGEALANKAKDVFSSGVPNQTRPVNSSSFSFDFSGALNKIVQPFRQAADPRSAAGSQVILTAGDSISELLRAGTDKLSSILRGNNEKPAAPVVSVSPASALTSGVGSLGEFFAALAQNPAPSSAANPDSIAAAAAVASRNSVYLIGGAALILVYLSVSKAR